MEERFAGLNFAKVSVDEAKVVAATGPAPQPERFGRYVLLDRIGMGGMAEVFRAVMPGAEGFRQTFVVKRILAERSRASDFVEMFVQEARIGSMLSHPNIVQVFDFGNVGGDYFLAMEYLRGRDVQALMRRLRRENLLCPVPVAAFIAHEVSVCLGYAHDLVGPDGKRLNIVHRDVSPSNIMCLRTGGVKLLDFGIAKAAGEQTENTEQGLFKGKLAYVAPERIKNEPIDGRVDLFGLGVVLWEMLAGKRLFRGKSELATLNNVLEMKVPPPSAVRPDVPASLDAVVLRALERDPAARYQTGQQMADDLEPVLRETAFHSRMVGDLLHEAFGSDLSTSQESLSKVTPELLAKLAGEEPGTGTLPSSSGPKKGRQWSWQRGFSLVGAAAVTAALAGLLLARGGGGSSYARLSNEATPAVPAPALDPVPPAVTTPAPSAATAPSASAARGEAARDEEAGDEDPSGSGKRRSKRSHRHHSSRKDAKDAQDAKDAKDAKDAPEDRVVRGLSIDPFAEAKRGEKP